MRFSVITISYNSVKTIENTIKSVLCQNYDDYEYIIIDGGSTDGTLDIIAKYTDRISKFVSEPDRGISDAFNKGIKFSEGALVGFINSDDFLAKDCLSKLNEYIGEDLQSDVYYGNMGVINPNGKAYICSPTEDINNLKEHFMICHPATFVCKKAYLEYGVYDLKYKYAMDFELFSRFYIRGAKFSYVPIVLSFFNKGGTSKQNAKRTVKESISISIRNGTNPIKANSYYHIANMHQKIFDLMNRVGIEETIRKIVKGQSHAEEEVFWF